MRWAWARIALALWLTSACGGALPPVDVIGEPTRYQGRVVVARGPTVARTGDACEVEVHGANGAYLNCRIRIRCGGDLVYGLSGAGYNHCRREEERFVFAHDHAGTRADGDPRMFFDLQTGRIVISDDEPDVEVLVDLLHAPPGYAGPSAAGSEELGGAGAGESLGGDGPEEASSEPSESPSP
ncbi:MAG: hypothetical protein IT378_18815 [Sandaracinaceae bacterium]|nr:hypothetical protein [Sandaracinaceae bacterium]